MVVIKQDNIAKMNIMNREFTHKSWGYELSIIPREFHHQLQFKDWIEYSGAEIGV